MPAVQTNRWLASLLLEVDRRRESHFREEMFALIEGGPPLLNDERKEHAHEALCYRAKHSQGGHP